MQKTAYAVTVCLEFRRMLSGSDRKSTRLNSSHTVFSYAVFCLRSEEHTSQLQSHSDLVCRLLLEKKNTGDITSSADTGDILPPREIDALLTGTRPHKALGEHTR